MIKLSFDLLTGNAKLSQTTVIKFGSAVPVQVVFSATPGVVTGIELALGTDAAAPQILAFTDVFTPDNDTTWSGLLDANDTRLRAFIAGKGPTSVNAELVAIIDGISGVAVISRVGVVADGGETSLRCPEECHLLAVGLAGVADDMAGRIDRGAIAVDSRGTVLAAGQTNIDHPARCRPDKATIGESARREVVTNHGAAVVYAHGEAVLAQRAKVFNTGDRIPEESVRIPAEGSADGCEE